MVTAKRSCVTRSPRRTSGSTRSRPASRTAMIPSTTTMAIPMMSTACTRRPHRAKLPMASPGPGILPAMAKPWAISTSRASPVASQRGRWRTWTMMATATNRAPVAAAATPAAAAHAAPDPGRRRAASWPATTPMSRPEKAIDRTRCTTGRVSTSRRGTGASRRWRTSGGSMEIGPPSLPLRRPKAMASAAPAPSTAGPWSAIDAICDALAGSSDTRPLSHRITPPPTSAARYTRYAISNHSSEPNRRSRLVRRICATTLAMRRGTIPARRARSAGNGTHTSGRGRRGGAAVLQPARPGRRRRRRPARGGPVRRPVVGADRPVRDRRRRRRPVDRVPGRRDGDGRQPLLLRVRALHPVHAVLVPAHRHVPTGRDPAGRRHPTRPRRALVRGAGSPASVRSSRRTTTSSSGTRRWRAAASARSPRRAPSRGSASSAS